MPNEGVQRGSLMHGDGDALSPYYPSKKELFKGRTIEEVGVRYLCSKPAQKS